MILTSRTSCINGVFERGRRCDVGTGIRDESRVHTALHPYTRLVEGALCDRVVLHEHDELYDVTDGSGDFGGIVD